MVCSTVQSLAAFTLCEGGFLLSRLRHRRSEYCSVPKKTRARPDTFRLNCQIVAFFGMPSGSANRIVLAENNFCEGAPTGISEIDRDCDGPPAGIHRCVNDAARKTSYHNNPVDQIGSAAKMSVGWERACGYVKIHPATERIAGT